MMPKLVDSTMRVSWVRVSSWRGALAPGAAAPVRVAPMPRFSGEQATLWTRTEYEHLFEFL